MKKAFLVVTALLVAGLLCTSGMAYNCSSSNLHETVQNLANSVAYNTETEILSFTIPKDIPQGYSLFIHVSARLKMYDGGMSFHALEKESESGNWELGKTYTVKLSRDALLQALVVVALKEKYNSELLYEKTITVDEKGALLIS